MWVRVAREGGERLASQPPQPTRGPSSLPTGAGPALPPALAAGAAGLPGVGWAWAGRWAAPPPLLTSVSGSPCSLQPAWPAAPSHQQSDQDALPHHQEDPDLASQHRPRPPSPALLADTAALPVQVRGLRLVGSRGPQGLSAPPQELGL